MTLKETGASGEKRVHEVGSWEVAVATQYLPTGGKEKKQRGYQVGDQLWLSQFPEGLKSMIRVECLDLPQLIWPMKEKKVKK